MVAQTALLPKVTRYDFRMATPKSIRRIGMLTGGGDCPGINAVIRAVAKTAMCEHDLQVFGIEDGYLGLLENRISELTPPQVSGILTRGGTILGTNNKCNPERVFAGNDSNGKPMFASKVDQCLKNIAAHKLDALIIIGGDGTMSCTTPFIDAGVTCIGVPKTIDNDIVGTDITFGFITGYTTAADALDRLHTTAASHHRVMICEVMGRNAGWLALNSGVASGSDVILIPEIPYDIAKICKFVEARRGRQIGFSIIVVAEGARPAGGAQVVAKLDPTSHDPVKLGGIGERVSNEIADLTDLDTRTTVLGHVVRGGTPVAADRVLATQLGNHAIETLMRGGSGRMIVMRSGALDDIDLRTVAGKQRLVPPDHPLIAAARAVRTSFGD